MAADVNTLWNECLNIFKDNVEEASFNTWFKTITPISFENKTLKIGIPSPFFREFLEENYASLIGSAIHRVFGTDAQLIYNISIDSGARRGSGSTDIPGNTQGSERRRPIPEFDSHLNINYNFGNFIEGECNKLPRAAGINIASEPGKSIFNPLFIYGKSGMGKTHLANAIGLKVKELHPQKRVLYVSANLFQLQFTEASHSKQLNNFLQYYQRIDVLIIDDVQEFALGNKLATQNTFFHIFSHLLQNGKQVILTCDKKPAELEGLEDRILSRFKSALAAEIETPDYETRRSILLAKIKQNGLKIPDAVVDYIATNVKDSIRSLEGTIVSLIAQSTINQKTINLDLVRKVVSNIVTIKENQLSTKDIKLAVCDYFRIESDDLASDSRKREIVQARQIAMYFAKKLTKDSLSTIGNIIGRRNHATVLHACKTVKDLIETDKRFKSSIEDIEQKLVNA